MFILSQVWNLLLNKKKVNEREELTRYVRYEMRGRD